MRNLLCVGLMITAGACDEGFKYGNPDAGQVVQGWDSCLQSGGSFELLSYIDNNAATDHGEIIAVDVSGSNQVAISASDGSLTFWTVTAEGEIQTATPKAKFEVGTNLKTSIAYSSNGLLSLGSEAGAIHRFDPASGTNLHASPHGSEAVTSIDVSGNDEWIAAADDSFGGNMKVHDMQSTEINIVDSRLWAVGAVLWNAGDLYIAGDNYGIVTVERWSNGRWQEAADEWMFHAETAYGHIKDVAVTNDGVIIAVGSGSEDVQGAIGSIAKIDRVTTGERSIIQVSGHNPDGLALTLSGEHFVTAAPDGLRAWSTRDLTEVARMELSQVNATHMLPNGVLVVADEIGVLRTYQCR